MTSVVTPSTPTLGKSWSDSATVNGEYGGGTRPDRSTSTPVRRPARPGRVRVAPTPATSWARSAPRRRRRRSRRPTTWPRPPLPRRPWVPGASTRSTSPNGNYFTVWGAPECFSVYPPGTVTTTHTSAGVIVIGGSAFDTATVTGDSAHGAPTGTVTFYSCSSPGGTGCTGGTEIPGTSGSPNPATLTASGSDTSTASSPSITPSSPGTYCFGAVYTPNVTKYTGSSDNMHGTVVFPNECFTVGRATPTIATILATPTSTGVGNAWGDSTTPPACPRAVRRPVGSASRSARFPRAPRRAPVAARLAHGRQPDLDERRRLDVRPRRPHSRRRPSARTASTRCTRRPRVDNYTAACGPAECFTVTPATPTIATTLVTPSSTMVGNAWGDSATVTGEHECRRSHRLGQLLGLRGRLGRHLVHHGRHAGGHGDEPDLDERRRLDVRPQAHLHAGQRGDLLLLLGVHAGDERQLHHGERPRRVLHGDPGQPMLSTQQSGSHSGAGSVTLGTSVTDVATIVGNPTSGAPTGTITFTECATVVSAVCPSGTAVGSAVTLSSTGDSSSATSVSFQPSATGTYCFAAVYTPDTGSNYVTADDNMAAPSRRASASPSRRSPRRPPR